MRFDKPVGIFLLWMPTAWALWTANNGTPSLMLLFYFFLGTVLMRAAGCVMNDIADRDIDKHVSRTKNRPLTSQQLSLSHAVILLTAILFVCFLIVLQLPFACLYYAFIALFLTILYPFCKRFFQAPQIVLGAAFSMAIPMVFVASDAFIDTSVWLLVSINILWVVSYDTMYAMVDRKDDLKIGVKSTAVLLNSWDRTAIFTLQFTLHILWLFFSTVVIMNNFFYFFWGIGGLILCYQQALVNTRDEPLCFKAFLTNVWYGVVMWIGLILGFSI